MLRCGLSSVSRTVRILTYDSNKVFGLHSMRQTNAAAVRGFSKTACIQSSTKNMDDERAAIRQARADLVAKREASGLGIGPDYPVVEDDYHGVRDPEGVYYDHVERRNFGQTLAENEDMNSVFAINEENDKYSDEEVRTSVLGIGTILGLLFLFCKFTAGGAKEYKCYHRDLPYQNLYLEIGGDPEKFEEFGIDPYKLYTRDLPELIEEDFGFHPRLDIHTQ